MDQSAPNDQESSTTSATLTTGTEATTTTTTTTTTVDAPDSGLIELEIAVFDWTSGPPPPEPQVVLGDQSWAPDLEFGGDGPESFGSFQVGEPGTFVVYPDGIGGTEIVVGFVMTDEMISGSDMSLTHVEIYDKTVLVWGQAIPEFEVEFAR